MTTLRVQMFGRLRLWRDECMLDAPEARKA
jgi:hypothetical protein